MEFIQAAKLARKGKRIRRPGWKGYWYLRQDSLSTYTWVIHTKDNKEIDKDFNQDTINNCLAKDWEKAK